VKQLATDFFQSALISIALFIALTAYPVFAALSCSVTTAAACTGTVILRMSASTNAHVELPSQSTASYASNVICCSGVSGLGNSCSGTFAVVAKLAATTNSHIQQNTQTGYANNACISISAGTVSIGYQSSNCTGFDTTLASMPAVTNSHIGGPSDYTNKICASAAATSLTFTINNQGFASGATTVTPGTAIMATSTLVVNTTNSTGWNVTLSGDNKSTTNNNLQRSGDTTVQISDQTEWINGAATTTAGNAVRIGSLASSGNVLAFRVMSASSTNGTGFQASSWWGSADNYLTDSASTLYAGIASSTVQRQIGNANTPNVSGSDHLNDVQYYLKVPITQKNGTYTANITYTATANP